MHGANTIFSCTKLCFKHTLLCHQCSMAEEACGLLLQADGQKQQRKNYTREEKLTEVSTNAA